MRKRLFFNECSLLNWSCPELDSKSRVEQFVDTLHILTSKGCERALCTPPQLITMPLGCPYTLSQWLNDSTIDPDRIRFLKSLITKAPYFNGEGEDDYSGIEASIDGIGAEGLLRCHLNDGIAVSIYSSVRWNCIKLDIHVSTLNEEGEVLLEDSSVRHASTKEHASNHSNFIENYIQENISTGKTLLSIAGELFPRIIFCRNAEDQIESLSQTNLQLGQLIAFISSLQNCLEAWTSSYLDLQNLSLRVSNESEATLNRYPECRTFLCPDGERKLFNSHAKISFQAWRVYFLINSESQTAYIGYVGKHLPTATG